MRQSHILAFCESQHAMELVDHFISLRFEHSEKKRYYHVVLNKDLFGDWVITKAWGGINQAQGRIVHLSFLSYAEARKTIEQIIKIRKQRGYLIHSPK